MLMRVRAVRAAAGVLVAAAMLAATATTAAAAEDEGELVDVTKTVSSLEKKMADLRERGQRARKGDLSASAVCGDAQAEPVFASWGDLSLYVPAAGGVAESPVTDAAWTSLDPAGEALLEQARARRLQGLRGRERTVKWGSLASFIGFVLLLVAIVPAASPPSLLLVFGLVTAYALATKVEFEVASGSVVPTQVVLVPMLFLLPPALVP